MVIHGAGMTVATGEESLPELAFDTLAKVLLVLGLAFCGGTLGDQVFYFLGRHYGRPMLARFPRWTCCA